MSLLGMVAAAHLGPARCSGARRLLVEPLELAGARALRGPGGSKAGRGARAIAEALPPATDQDLPAGPTSQVACAELLAQRAPAPAASRRPLSERSAARRLGRQVGRHRIRACPCQGQAGIQRAGHLASNQASMLRETNWYDTV